MRGLRDKCIETGLTWTEYINQKHKVSPNALGRKSVRIKGDKNNKAKSEKEIEKEIIQFLLRLKWPTWKMKVKGELQSTRGGKAILKKSENAGFPDILTCATSPHNPLFGLFVGIEVKKPGGVQSAVQQNQQDYIVSGRGIYIIATSVIEVQIALSEYGLYF